jgi:hypothetical protein
LAGFQVTTIGRIWVTAEAPQPSPQLFLTNTAHSPSALPWPTATNA